MTQLFLMCTFALCCLLCVRHTIAEIVNYSRITALERSVKIFLDVRVCVWGGGGEEGVVNLFYVATTLALSSAVVYTRPHAVHMKGSQLISATSPRT